jgi:hypothetical protein
MAELLKLLVEKKSGYSTQNSATTIRDHQRPPSESLKRIKG